MNPSRSDHVQGSTPPCRYLFRVMLSARGRESMRGIERFLAAILLVGAIGGAAALARYAGTEPAPPAFHVTASPRQHLTIPQTVVEIPLPKPIRVAIRRVVGKRPPPRFAAPGSACPVAGTPVTPPQAPPASPQPPVQAPAPAPAPAAPAAPVAAPSAPAESAPAPVAATEEPR